MSEAARRHTPRRRFEQRILVLSWALALVALGCAALLAWLLPIGTLMRAVVIAALAIVVGSLLRALFKSIVEPLRGLSSVIGAYRDGDYTVRSSRGYPGDALGELVREVNYLGDTLLQQRLRTMEATALLEKLIAAIDIVVIAFDGEGQLRLFNPAALQLLRLDAADAMGRSASELGFAELLAEQRGTHIATSVCGRSGRWQVTHGTFRDEGISQHLLIISDVSRVLREEERGVWQRLIRVIGHEINNSMAPIKSIAGTLHDALDQALPGGALREDVLPALRIIGDRATALQRFLAQYGRLARLPAPRRRWIRLAPLLMRVAALEQSHRIELSVADDLEAFIDEDQLEQALINLLRNAVEANGEAAGQVRIAAHADNALLGIVVTDEGAGIANPDNLFVPFFSTKPGGGGVGLLLSRQIAEAHGGTLSLGNRSNARGAIATLELPNTARRGT